MGEFTINFIVEWKDIKVDIVIVGVMSNYVINC